MAILKLQCASAEQSIRSAMHIVKEAAALPEWDPWRKELEGRINNLVNLAEYQTNVCGTTKHAH